MADWLGIGTAVGGLLGNAIGANQQNKATQKFMGIQKENQKELNQQGHDLQYEMWKKTNYPAQLAMMKEAGLSTGLMYGQGGGGGTTAGSQGGGSATSGGQGANPMDLNVQNAMQLALLKSQKENIDANTNKTNKEANKIGGIDTTEGETRVTKLLAEIENEKLKGNLMKAQEAKTMEETEKIFQETQIYNIDRQLKNETFDEVVKTIKLQAIEKEIDIQAKELNIELTEEQIRAIQNEILQKWVQVGVNGINAITGSIGNIIRSTAKKPKLSTEEIHWNNGNVSHKTYN